MSPYIYKSLRENKKLIKNRAFPILYKNRCKKSVVLIGVGGNMGDVKRRFSKLLVKLKRENLLTPISTSIIFKNPPFGYLNQPYFYNSVILASTSLSPIKLLRYLQRLERYFKRKREFKNSPRTLDLDIIFYEKRVIKSSLLTIPHYGWKSRESVLVPMKYIKGKRCLKRVLLPQHLKRLID